MREREERKIMMIKAQRGREKEKGRRYKREREGGK